MSVLRPTYPEKTNNPADADSIRKFYATEANEVHEVLDNHADELEDILDALGLSGGTNSLGEFVSLEVLQTAYPDGAEGSYAVINDGLGTTPQVATYNESTNLWETAVPDDPVIYVANMVSLPGTGTANKLYLAKDSGVIYYWEGGEYKIAGAQPPVSSLNTYIDINSTNIAINQKVMGRKAGINGGSFFIGTAIVANPTTDAHVTKDIEF